MFAIQEIVASGFPWAASQRATTTSEEPACTGTGAAEFLGLAKGEWESEKGYDAFKIFVHQTVKAFEIEGLRQSYTDNRRLDSRVVLFRPYEIYTASFIADFISTCW